MNKKGIFEAGDLPEDEKVHLRKDIFGWRVVYPIRNPEGKLLPLNTIFGNPRTFILLIVCVLLFLLIIGGAKNELNSIESRYHNISSDPVGYCNNINNLFYNDTLWEERSLMRVNLSTG